ncbi:MAG: UvrD-helicase domain-containing protein [Chlamydiales bacterium]|nr:UvrD-helicase domain-containing protein [Chlamydiales bacterium]
MDFSTLLNPAQIEAVNHLEGPLLVLAGAGSGKTRVVTCRIAQLIESGVPPSQILAVTFTNKAAGEMRERIHSLLPRSDFPTICTFHSLGVKILRESIQRLGYAQNFTIYDEEDSNKLLKGSLQSVGITKETKTFRGLISQAKNALQAPSEVDLSDLPRSTKKIFPEVYSLYQQRLKEANALDFDDLLYLTVRLFQKDPDILAEYQQRWPYLLIDEYQDTNQAQYLMARLIVGEKCNLFVVGDPDQSIYSWRGANIENILNFERDYPGARVVRLEQNYRSTTNILDAANSLIRFNNSRYEKTLWSNLGEGNKITLFVGETEREEAGFVVQEIERLHTLHQIPLSQMTIFYRTNFQSRLFEDFLLRKRLPYVIVGGISFYQRKEIKDLLAFMRMLASDHDVVSFERTINLPKRGIGLTTIEKIRARAAEEEIPLFTYCAKLTKGESDGVRLSAKQREGLIEYVAMIQNLRGILKTSSLQKLVIETVRQTRYIDLLREDKETFEDRKGNIDELIAKAREWEVMNDSNNLEAFLEELSLKGSIDEANFLGDKVNLMTLHNGKGLEFNVAFLVGMEEDLFPHANSRNSHDALEEERRLCYVGMTRAKQMLYLSAAETRFLWGQHRMMRPSRFLREIPKKYLERFY